MRRWGAVRLFVVGTCMCLFVISPAWAQKLSAGIATSVTDTAGLLDVKEHFAPAVDALAKSLKVQAGPVSSVSPALLAGSLKSAREDILIVLASDGWRAQNEFGWKLVALSDDAQGNVMHVVAGKSSAVTNTAGLKGKKLAASGAFARDVLNALLKQNGMVNQVGEIRDTRDPQALSYFLDNGFADAVITRDLAQLRRMADAGHRVILKTEPIPVYAVIVNPKADLDRTDKIKNAITALKLPAEFSAASGIRAFKLLNAEHSVALALFD
jgi:phosphonate transport system substrate-binding protein